MRVVVVGAGIDAGFSEALKSTLERHGVQVAAYDAGELTSTATPAVKDAQTAFADATAIRLRIGRAADGVRKIPTGRPKRRRRG